MNDKTHNLKTFHHNALGRLRTMMIDGKPWFVSKDVAACLGYRNTSSAVFDHVDDEDKSVAVIDEASSMFKQGIINEVGLFSMIVGCRLPTAKRFMRWIVTEVLPILRENRESVSFSKKDLLEDPDSLIAAPQTLKAEREKAVRHREEATAQKKQPEELRQDEQAQKADKVKQASDWQEDEEDGGFGLLIIVLQEG